MPLVTMREMLKEARAHRYAVGAFEFWSYDSAYAVASAAKSLNVPVILQVGPFEKDFMDGYKNAVTMAKMAADPATQAWWDVVKPLMQPLDDRKEGEFWSDMEEIYHLD